jgi:hypothetical protein
LCGKRRRSYRLLCLWSSDAATTTRTPAGRQPQRGSNSVVPRRPARSPPHAAARDGGPRKPMPIAAKQSTLHATRSRPSAARVSAIDPLLFLLAMAGQLGQPRSTRLHWREIRRGPGLQHRSVQHAPTPATPEERAPHPAWCDSRVGPPFPPCSRGVSRTVWFSVSPYSVHNVGASRAFFFVSFSMLFDVYF